MKRLVVCCDGTWNKPDQKELGLPSETNVAKIALAVALLDPSKTPPVVQRVYYDTGVGTGRFDRFLGGAFGAGLSENVRQAYSFLLTNYEPGDELYFFGFSRGAYTARSTVGFIRNCGLLRREYAAKLSDAYDLYRRRDPASHPRELEAGLFRKSFSYEPRVKFIGVWDTVGALGIPFETPLISKFNENWRFHDTDLCSWVDNAFQALAIDERRKPFRPSIWNQSSNAKKAGQRLEQVWFAGVHSNVGGGYGETGLSDIALLWMMARATACGLAFDKTLLPEAPAPNPLGKLRDSQKWFYWLLGGNYVRPLGVNFDEKDNPRPDAGQSAASTAKERLDDKARGYKPANLQSFLAAGGKQTPVP